MNAHTVVGAVTVVAEYTLDREMVLEVECRNFDHYRTLPSVVSFRGIECVRTGWSSDTCLACYKQSCMIARKVTG